MASNFYAKNPLKVVILSPKNGKTVRTYIFLGQVPRSILDAAKRGDNGKWKSQDAALLEDFYGARWRAILSQDDVPTKSPGVLESQLALWRPDTMATLLERTSHLSITGGEANGEANGEADDDYIVPPELEEAQFPLRATFGNLEDFDTIGEDVVAEPIQDRRSVRPDAAGTTPVDYVISGPPIYTTLPTYPEDTIADLKMKILAATGMSPFRQHMFYMGKDGLPRLPYRIYLEGAPVAVDARSMFAAEDSESVVGIPIDRRMESKREEIRIDALDAFQKLEIVGGSFLEKIYIVDLYSVLRPIGSEHHPDLPSVLRDRYQFDLLYYGGALKYWPQLSPDALLLALSDPAGMEDVYPLLAPNKGIIESKVRAEQAIIDRTYAFSLPTDPKTRPAVAVTHATVHVSPRGVRMRANIRNVFDWIPMSWTIPAATVRFPHIDPTTGTSRTLSVVKRHPSSYMPQMASSVDWFVSHTGKRNAAHFALSRGMPEEKDAKSSSTMSPLAYLSLSEDAKYSVESWWREDDRISFENVIGDILSVSGNLIDTINGMAEAAFPTGGKLRQPTAASSSDAVTTFGAITASAFWPHAVTSAGFRELKERWRTYEKAGIVGIRGLQQSGAFTFQFRKGITGYDPSAIERVSIRRVGQSESADEKLAQAPSTSTESVANNRYAYLTDPGIALRWNYLFGGRMVRIHHRATDLRIEVVGANGIEEFETIRRYIFAFLEGVRSGPDRIAGIVEKTGRPAPVSEPLHGPGTRRLRRLQERDPNLFDLKKFDPNATVYSVLCQAGRQPHVYTESEAATMNKVQKAKLSRYMNFTDGTPAYYECPSAQYPFMSWRSGKHPLGYCLPCCKRTRPAIGSRAALVNDQCLTRSADGEHKEEPVTDTTDIISRHVLSYGKSIPIGRVSDVAPSVAQGLLLEALPSPYALRLIGVEQSCPGVPSSGFMYSLALAIAVSDESLSDVIAALCEAAISIGDSYRALGSGAAAVFPSPQDLSDALVGAFVRRETGLSPLGPGGVAGSSWRIS